MVNTMACVTTLALVFALHVSTTLACNGYTLTVNKIDVCKDVDSVVSVQNLSVSLSEDCRIIPTGCISTRPFTSAMVHYKLYKVDTLLRFEGDVDGCKAIDNVPDEIKAILEAVTAFAKCPAKQGQICDDKNAIVDISKYSKYLSMAEGRIRGEIKANHGTEKTCVKFDVNIFKKGADARKTKTGKKGNNMKKFMDTFSG